LPIRFTIQFIHSVHRDVEIWPCAAGTPLNFYSAQSRMFALALPADGSDTSECTWSPPVTVVYPGIPELHLNIPVTEEWVSRNLVAPGAAAQAQPVPALVDASRTGSLNLGRCSKSLLTSKQQVASSGDGLELRPKTVAVVRLSMQVRLGCVI
jgi:hypothetical protein